MRVIVAHNQYRSELPSGENAVVEQEIRWLTAAGVTVVPFLRSSDEIPSLPLREKVLLPLAPIWSPSAQADLVRLIREHRPHVLHLHNPYPLISPWVVRTAHRFGVPVVQTVHNYRQVCAPGLYYRDGQICQDCRGRTIALPAIRHRCYRGSLAQSAVMAVALAAHRPTWRSVDRFFAPTEAMAAHLRDYGIAADRIVVKPNSVDDPGDPPAHAGEGVLFGGRLSAEKGLRLLLDAWPVELGRLRVAGDGELRSLVAQRPEVDYLGRLDSAGMRAAIRAAALVVVPSTLHDVHPTIVIEALANGRPVLGTRLGGIPDLIGPAGWVVEPTVEALASALVAAVRHAPALGSVARQHYLATFTPEASVHILMREYLQLARR
ncbi:MAG TPA: glycosyl transferase family 1 [Micromonosporaceae bacterium]|nr:glycosyl transferase family 1 [Micromonosporaceae bacterium]HCU51314.1 glycosyl transferase family 1 [Micromonosporaceae bacterium]